MKNEKRSTTNLSREDFIKKKTIKTLLSINLVILAIMSLFSITLGFNLMWIIAVSLCVIIFDFTLKKLCYTTFDYDFNIVLGIHILNNSLSSETYTEVIPLHRIYEHSYFLVSLTNIAKFYAIIKNESEVSIFVQFNTEDELRFLENIPKEKFHIRYKLQ